MTLSMRCFIPKLPVQLLLYPLTQTDSIQSPTHTHQRPIIMISIYCLITLFQTIYSQVATVCPAGSPPSSGNTPDTYYSNLLPLTNFLQPHAEEFCEAFEQYLLTGDSSIVSEEISESLRIHLLAIGLASLGVVVMIVALVRSSRFRIVEAQQFIKAKKRGLTTAVCGSFLVVGLTFIVFTAFLGYIVPQLIESLETAQCRAENLEQVFLEGAASRGWGGVNRFIGQLSQASSMAGILDSTAGGATINATRIDYASKVLSQAQSAFLSMQDQHNKASITLQDGSQSISFADVVPDLFNSSTSSPLTKNISNHLTDLHSAISAYTSFQQLLTDLTPYLNSTHAFLSNKAQQISLYRDNYISRSATFRNEVSIYHSKSLSVLVVGQIIVALGITSGLILLISLKLIQQGYDMFSLKVFKATWGCFLISFVLHLALVSIVNEMGMYTEGACQVADGAINNVTRLKEVLPEAKGNSGLAMLSGCVYKGGDIANVTRSKNEINSLYMFAQLKESVEKGYRASSLHKYSEYITSLKQQIREHQFGLKGSNSIINARLASLNTLTSTDPHSESCLSHKWALSPKDCPNNVPIIAMPQNQLTYPPSSTQCYILSNHPNPNPAFIAEPQMIALYTALISQPACSSTMNDLPNLIHQLHQALNAQDQAFSNLISRLDNLETHFVSLSQYLVPWLQDASSFLTAFPTPAFTTLSTDCQSIEDYLVGAYNAMCVTHRGIQREIKIVVYCCLVFLSILISLAFMYTLELQHIHHEDFSFEDRTAHETKRMLDDERTGALEENSHSSEGISS